MVKLDAFVFGYKIGYVEPEDVSKLINIFMKLSISADVSGGGRFVIRARDFKAFKRYCGGRLRYTVGDVQGLPGFIGLLMRRKGIVAAFIVFMLLHIFSSAVIWDIRIEGAERLSDDEVLRALGEQGFEIGDAWRDIDKNFIETNVLVNCKDISWISINRRGTVAYVRIMESENIGAQDKEAPLYSNILADRDAVVEEIRVEKGMAVVKVGDVVKKGDILISGIVETESGTYFCRAAGVIIGQSVSDVSVEVSRKGIERSYLEDFTREIRINLFKISINIFKNYRICLNDYDIIENVREYALLGKYDLPLSLSEISCREYENIEVFYSDDEMTVMARELLNEKIRNTFDESEILKMRSFGEFTDEGYRLITEVVYLTNIANESAIEVS